MIYEIQCVDYGWKAKIKTKYTYKVGDLCICRGCVCVIRREIHETDSDK